MSNKNYRTLGTLFALVTLAGCANKPTPPPVIPLAAPPQGRLVPAVVAGFEHGVGAWQAEVRFPRKAAVAQRLNVRRGGASRGEGWLAAPIATVPDRESEVDMYVQAPRLDWSRFGDTLRADVRISSRKPTANARLYVVGPDGKETFGPASPVGSSWSTLVWSAGPALQDVVRLGVRWTVKGTWAGRLGLDNVRVGAAAGLNEAWSVAVGPYPSREAAVSAMPELVARKVPCFPVFAEAWYLNVGTFSSQSAAEAESKRLAEHGIKATIVQR
jgi:hypothetical protein